MGKRKVTQPQRNAIFFKKSQNEELWFGEKVYFLSEVYPESNFTAFAVNLQEDQTNIY